MEDTKTTKGDLTTGVVWKRMLLFMLPIAAGTLIQQLYNAVDGLVVGRFVGTEALAAVGGSAAQISNTMIGFFVSMTVGASVVIAQIFGAGLKEKVRAAAGNAILIAFVTGLVLCAVGWLAAPALLRLMNTPADTMQAAILYMRIFFFGAPFGLTLNMESNMLRALGDSYHPFIYMIVGCVSNIIMDLLFVVAFGWGVAGVAIATVIAQAVNMILLSVRFMTADEFYRIGVSDLKFKGEELGRMIRLGIPSGLQNSMYSVSNVLIQVGVNTLGTVVVASWAMSGKVDGFFWAFNGALGSCATAFAGQNYGAQKLDRVKACVKQGLLIGHGFSIVLCAAMLAFARPILAILTTDAAVIDTTVEILWYFVPFYWIMIFIEIYSAVMRGSGDALVPVIITGIGTCLTRVIWIMTVFAYFKTLFSMSIVYAVSWSITATAMYIYFKRGSILSKAFKSENGAN